MSGFDAKKEGYRADLFRIEGMLHGFKNFFRNRRKKTASKNDAERDQ